MAVLPGLNRRQALNAPRDKEAVSDRYLVGMLGQFLRPYWKQLALVFGLLIAVSALSSAAAVPDSAGSRWADRA